MTTTKYRISNVLAWLGFTIVLPMITMLFALVIQAMPPKSPAEDCIDCYVLTQNDIDGSANLKRKQAELGDWIEAGKLTRQKLLLGKEMLSIIDDYLDSLFLLHLLFWLIAGIANYIMVGSFRIRPWLHVPGFEDNKR